MSKTKNLFLCTLPLLLALIIHIVIILSASTIYQKVSNECKEMGATLNELVLILAAAVCIVIYGRWYMYISSRQSLKYRNIFSIKLILLLCFLGVCLQIEISLLLYLLINSDITVFSKYKEAVNAAGNQITIITLIFEVIFAPISDELIFRGVILSKCKNNMPLFAANIFQSLLFGIYHMNLLQGMYAFILGLFLGYIMLKFNSLLVSVILHMIINLTGNLILFVPENAVSSYPLAVFLIGAAAVACITIVISKLEINNPRAKQNAT